MTNWPTHRLWNDVAYRMAIGQPPSTPESAAVWPTAPTAPNIKFPLKFLETVGDLLNVSIMNWPVIVNRDVTAIKFGCEGRYRTAGWSPLQLPVASNLSPSWRSCTFPPGSFSGNKKPPKERKKEEEEEEEEGEQKKSLPLRFLAVDNDDNGSVLLWMLFDIRSGGFYQVD